MEARHEFNMDSLKIGMTTISSCSILKHHSRAIIAVIVIIIFTISIITAVALNDFFIYNLWLLIQLFVGLVDDIASHFTREKSCIQYKFKSVLHHINRFWQLFMIKFQKSSHFFLVLIIDEIGRNADEVYHDDYKGGKSEKCPELCLICRLTFVVKLDWMAKDIKPH